MRARWAIWVWLCPDGSPFYVGRGMVRNGQHPAERVWNYRKNRDSELNVYLRNTFAEEPIRSDSIPDFIIDRIAATVLWEMLREEYERDGFQLLSPRVMDRPLSTYNAGFKNRRAVIAPDGTRYVSVRQAARAVGLTPATITLHCQRGKTWHYADAAAK